MIRPDRDIENGLRPGTFVRRAQSVIWRSRLAWIAHFYTALGLVMAAGMAVFIVWGGREGFRWAFALMVMACLVDATDGSLARRLKVKDLLPNFDGAKLDDLIDFLTFTSLPLALIWRAELLPAAALWVVVVALLASAYGFCQIPAKTTDGYFVGFPSYWNIVAFYLYALEISGWIAAAVVLGLALLTFVPSYYMYPSRGATLSRTTNFLGGVWVVLLAAVLWTMPGEETPASGSETSPHRSLALLSLFYPAYYMAVSWGITVYRWRRVRLR
jgi:phosphatidylcholine synthase